MAGQYAGVETILYAVKNILNDVDTTQEEYVLKPSIFGKRMKGLNPYDRHNLLTRRELRAFRNQLLKVVLHWNEYDDEWVCKDLDGEGTRVKFVRREEN